MKQSQQACKGGTVTGAQLVMELIQAARESGKITGFMPDQPEQPGAQSAQHPSGVETWAAIATIESKISRLFTVNTFPEPTGPGWLKETAGLHPRDLTREVGVPPTR